MKILLAPNSFKECADSVTISKLLGKYLKRYFNPEGENPDISFIEKPISDGGDGFLNVCKNNFNLEIKTQKITYPFSEEEFECEYGLCEDRVYIESAKVLGLSVIPKEKRHPLYLSSKGLGDMIKGILYENAGKGNKISKVIIGIGGTGTSDFGIGMYTRFGLKLMDKNNNELEPIPIHFSKVKNIVLKTTPFAIDIEIVIDVTTPLLGKQGAARVFAPQKGAAPNEVEILENGLENVINILYDQYSNFRIEELYGAGGGLAGGLHYFLGGKYVFAKDFIRNEIGINSNTLQPDIIITGEGTFDIQSTYNKGAILVMDEYRLLRKPIFVITGILKDFPVTKNDENLYFIELSKYFKNKDESIQNIEKGIKLASKEIFEICKSHQYIS